MAPNTTGSEDFQGLSQGGPLPPVDADGEVPNWGSEQVELLCQKAQSLVRQMGAQALGFDTSRPPSARSSPCIKVSPPQASPCTPTPHRAGPGLNFSPGPRVLPDITNLSREDVADFRHRLSQVEQALHLGQAPNSEAHSFEILAASQHDSHDSTVEVLKLRGRMQTVESELVDVRAELREVRAAVSRLSEKMDVPEPLGTPGLIRTMPSSKQPVRLPCNQCQTVPQQVPQQMPQQPGAMSLLGAGYDSEGEESGEDAPTAPLQASDASPSSEGVKLRWVGVEHAFQLGVRAAHKQQELQESLFLEPYRWGCMSLSCEDG
eukprot:g16220.t1